MRSTGARSPEPEAEPQPAALTDCEEGGENYVVNDRAPGMCMYARSSSLSLPRSSPGNGGHGVSITSHWYLYSLRQDMLEKLGQPQNLRRVYQGRQHVLNVHGDEAKELFAVMFYSWFSASTTRGGRQPDGELLQVLSDRSLDEILAEYAISSHYASVQVLADVYCLWYGHDCLFSAQSEHDFRRLCDRLSRALDTCCRSPRIDSLVFAELLQIVVEFCGRATAAGCQHVCADLPIRSFRVPAASGVEMVAHNLWEQCMRYFMEAGCMYDAMAASIAMIMAAGSAGCKLRYLQALRVAAGRIGDAGGMDLAAREGANRHVTRVEAALQTHGFVTTQMLDLRLVFGPSSL
eukprot:TRINITY_DN28985_c0_g1_i1.p1 TRINITY_DN28985_c0_g1~~TRINITY_DN28985_c0_g1_i1.p1  ORF type:complete len:349 (-),score=18.15 TRINITY_DN28985_c0_g1_i1:242-1288(-)